MWSPKLLTDSRPTKSPSIPPSKTPKVKASDSMPVSVPVEELTSRSPKSGQLLDDAYNSLKCPYRLLCKKFLDTLQLPGRLYATIVCMYIANV